MDQERSKSQRASKSHQWFKSYGTFTEGGFDLLVELHREWSAPAACTAGLFGPKSEGEIPVAVCCLQLGVR